MLARHPLGSMLSLAEDPFETTCPLDESGPISFDADAREILRGALFTVVQSTKEYCGSGGGALAADKYPYGFELLQKEGKGETSPGSIHSISRQGDFHNIVRYTAPPVISSATFSPSLRPHPCPSSIDGADKKLLLFPSRP